MSKFKRVFIVILDSVGIGELPDAIHYGDKGSNTIVHIAEAKNGLHMPNMEKLGYGNIVPIQGISPVKDSKGFFTKMGEASVGKDTMTGHWELMGLRIDHPFQTFPEGFPAELLNELTERTGREIIGNKPASGTEILDELGEEQMKTGKMIVYTSADSVLQIAAHEDVIPLDELYRICEVARELTLTDEYKIGRVIARPYTGEPGNFKRTSNRHDYALKPFARTVMNDLKDNGNDVIAIGKINDIYDGEGVTEAIRTISNYDGMEKLMETAKKDFNGIAFLNLVDFDAVYGHRRNPEGYGDALEEYDVQLGELLPLLNEDDLLVITADHGNDPVHEGTDHTREYVPLVMYSPSLTKGKELPVRETFADVGATIASNFGVKMPEHGVSFLQELE